MTSQTCVKLIKYRMFASQLDDTEFDAFLSQWTRECGRNVILTPYFKQLTKQNSNLNIESLDTSIQIMKDIIQSRHSDHPSNKSLPTSINALPMELTGRIGSFLNCKEYINVSKCNRNSFIKLNTTNTLTELDLTTFNNYNNINLAKFKKLNHLKLKLNKIHQLSLPQHTSICNHLTQLTLDAEDSTQINITNFIQCKAINTNNIIQLRIESLGSWDEPFQRELMLTDIFKKFPVITGLTLHNCYVLITVLDLHDLMPNLERFSWNGGNVSVLNQFISVFGGKLKTLSIAHDDGITMEEDVSFRHLEKLTLISPIMNVLNGILETAVNLRNIHIDNSNASFLENAEFMNIITKLISEYNGLEYLGINEWQFDNWECLCDAIERGLYQIRCNKKRLRLSLKFSSSLSMNPETTDVFIKLTRLMNQFKASQISDWMLICGFDGQCNETEHDWERHFKVFAARNSDYAEMYWTGKDIVIKNKGCVICGYKESDILQCK